MKNNAVKARNVIDRVRPIVHQDSREIQPYGTIAKLPIALAESVCKASVENLELRCRAHNQHEASTQFAPLSSTRRAAS